MIYNWLINKIFLPRSEFVRFRAAYGTIERVVAVLKGFAEKGTIDEEWMFQFCLFQSIFYTKDITDYDKAFQWGFVRKVRMDRIGYCLWSNEATEAVKDLGPIVSLGAGMGWAEKLLAANGLDIVATDKAPPPSEWFNEQRTYFPVEKLCALAAKQKYPERIPMIIWPPYKSLWPIGVAKTDPEWLIYVGEHEGGCCASSGFFAYLAKEYEEVRIAKVNQYEGMHDALYIYRKRKASG